MQKYAIINRCQNYQQCAIRSHIPLPWKDLVPEQICNNKEIVDLIIKIQ